MFLKKKLNSSVQTNTIVLAHGLGDTSTKMNKIEAHLLTHDFDVFSFSPSPSNGTVGIDELAEQLRKFVDRNIDISRKIDLVGFSMGGLICRYYLQNLGGINRTSKLITIATPHFGTKTAYFRGNIGAKQMRPDSNLLRNLNNDIAMLARVKVVSIYTPFDLMIVPSTSSRLPIGTNISIPVLLHPKMATDQRCLDAVNRALSDM